MPARLTSVPAGTEIFIDANVFVYHFTGVSSQCSEFLERCERSELLGITGVHIILEVLHRLMLVEAVAAGKVIPGNLVKKLRAKPDVVCSLSSYQQQTEAVLDMGVEVLPLEHSLVKRSWRFRKQHGLLVNDSVTGAMAEGLGSLATADQNFVRVPDLTIYSPRDI